METRKLFGFLFLLVFLFSCFSFEVVCGEVDVYDNGIWLSQVQLTEENLEFLVANKVYNIYLNVGYPNPSEYSDLTGIVPATEQGLVISQSTVVSDLALCASVSESLKLWAWFGTYGSGGHGATAAVDISTVEKYETLAERLVTIAYDWGFYGIQDDTEDYTASCLTESGQYGSWQVDFWNYEAETAHMAGLVISGVFAPPNWDLFTINCLPDIVDPDFLIMAALSPEYNSEAEWLVQAEGFIGNASLPVIVDFENDAEGNMATQINWVDDLSVGAKAKINSYAIYCWSTMTETDWDSWGLFMDGDPVPTGTPNPTGTVFPSVNPTVHRSNVVGESVPAFYMVILVFFAVVAVLVCFYVNFLNSGDGGAGKGVMLLLILVGFVIFLILLVGFLAG